MPGYRHLLLAVDLLLPEGPSIKKAVALAKIFNAKISLAHVVEPMPPYAEIAPLNIEEESVAYAKKALVKLGDEWGIAHTDLHLRIGAPKREIIDLAKELNVDLIVLGSHGRHGIFPMLGSTANAIVHNATCDVITIRGEGDLG